MSITSSGVVANLERAEVPFPSPHQAHLSSIPSLPSSPCLPPLPFPFVLPLLLPLEVGPLNPARESGERCKLPSGVWGRAPAEIEFGAFLPSGGNYFNDFPENQLTKFRAVFNSQGKSGPRVILFKAKIFHFSML